MSEDHPTARRKRSPETGTVDTTLVQFTSVGLPPDSPEFLERSRRPRPGPRLVWPAWWYYRKETDPMETAEMSRVTVEAKVENLQDLWDVQRGMLTADKVRSVVIPDALVDTGASTLALPVSLIQQLGLKKSHEKQAHTATGTATMSIYDVAQLTVMGRNCRLDVLEVPDGNPALIGQLALEMLCFVVDPKNQRLIGDPWTGGEQILDLF